MNYNTDMEEGSSTENNPAAPSAETALYHSDCDELPLDTRRVLVQLLTGPSIDAQYHSKLWPALIRDETSIRRYLAALFLELVIDQDTQVAFVRQADTEELDAPTLLRRAPLMFLESVLLLHLRQRLTQANVQGERAVISTQDIVEYLTLYQRAGSTDSAGFAKRIYAAIEKAKKYNILRKIRSSEDRFEISPTLKLLFSAEEIQTLTALYQLKMSDEPSSCSDNTPENVIA